ncbi:MAG TPA: RNB domain-containing ribonuclease [Blastocatellia bacterium]|nr:RNB domain-containing ribonuclease [Blastocatellia bacterium]
MSELDLSRLREQLGVRTEFPEAVRAAADEASRRPPDPDRSRDGRVDARDVPFVTVDPAGSRDLDQAFFARRAEGDVDVLYAIADVGHFVDRGGTIEAEAFERGVTFYSPDEKTPLYPTALSENGASLLPDVDRPCILFTIRVATDGTATLQALDRAVIRSRVALAYEDVSVHLGAERHAPGSGMFAGNEWSESLGLLEVVGRLRQAAEVARGGVSLPISAQHVQRWSAALTGYRLSFNNPDDVEGWNAQISLMTGICAAGLMRSNKVGLLRVLDPPAADRVRSLRLTATALGIRWPDEWSYAEFIRSLDPTRELDASVIFQASGIVGGARYEEFEGEASPALRHSAIADFYAHVTAPMRRLADRYALDLVVDLAAGRMPSAESLDTLRRLPDVMQAATRKASSLESSIVDHAEAALLAGRVGETFRALVVRVRADRLTVQIPDPPVRTNIPARVAFECSVDGAHPRLTEDGSALADATTRLALGDWIDLRLAGADTEAGKLSFECV